MPQTDFYLIDEDLLVACDHLLSLGVRLVPDRHYPTADYRELVCLDDVSKMQSEKKALLFFAVHTEWSNQPLPMRSVVRQRDGRKIYYLPQRAAPTLDIYCPCLRQEPQGFYVGTGFIAYHSTYYPAPGVSEKAPAGLRAAYSSVCKLLRKGSTRLRFSKRTLHVTERVKRSGYRLAGLGTSAEADTL